MQKIIRWVIAIDLMEGTPQAPVTQTPEQVPKPPEGQWDRVISVRNGKVTEQ